jgi:LysM repeat protein
MSVNMIIQFNGKYLTLPINPEKITPSRSASNSDIDIIGLGKATRKGEPGLTGLTLESFFPGPNSYFYKGNRPKSCVEFINEIWETENIENNVARLIITGIPVPIDIYFVINSFEYDHTAGEEEDIYYRLQIKKYIPYGVKLVDTSAINNTTVRVTSTNIVTNNTGTGNQLTYKVQKGDTLWNIAKASTGSGSDWKALYDLNKAVIGSNANLIKPGQVLTLPSNWKEPKNVVKLKPVSSTVVMPKDSVNSGYANGLGKDFGFRVNEPFGGGSGGGGIR